MLLTHEEEQQKKAASQTQSSEPEQEQQEQELDLDTFTQKAAKSLGVPDIYRRMVNQESGGSTSAVSYKGARGMFQLMPETARSIKRPDGQTINPDDPFDNVYGGLKYLRDNYDKFRSRAKSEKHAWSMAIAAYHAGPGRVEESLNSGGDGIPDWIDDGLINTREHTYRIVKDASESEFQLTSEPTPAPKQETQPEASDDVIRTTTRAYESQKQVPPKPVQQPEAVEPLAPFTPERVVTPETFIPSDGSAFRMVLPVSATDSPDSMIEKAYAQLFRAKGLDEEDAVREARVLADARQVQGRTGGFIPFSNTPLAPGAFEEAIKRGQETIVIDNPDDIEYIKARSNEIRDEKFNREFIEKFGEEPDRFNNAKNKLVTGFVGYASQGLKGLAALSASIDGLDTPADKTELYRQASLLAQDAEAAFPSDPRLQNEYIAAKIPEALGSAIATLSTGVAGGPIGIGVTGALSQAGSMYEEAKAAGATEQQATDAAWLGVPLGMTEMVPVATMANRLRKLFPGVTEAGLRTALKEAGLTAVKEGGEELIQNTSQGVLTNVVARYVYNSNKPIFGNLKDDAIVGVVTGTLLGGSTHLTSSAVSAGVERVRGTKTKTPEVQPQAPVVTEQPQASVKPQLPEPQITVTSGKPSEAPVALNVSAADSSVTTSTTGEPPAQRQQAPENQTRQIAKFNGKTVEILREDKVDGKARVLVQVQGEPSQRFVSPKELTDRRVVSAQEATQPVQITNAPYTSQERTETTTLEGPGRTPAGPNTIPVDGVNVPVDAFQKEAYRRLQQTYGDTIQAIRRMDISEEAKQTRIEEAKDKFQTLKRAIATDSAIESEKSNKDGWLSQKTTTIRKAFGTQINLSDVDANVSNPTRFKEFTPVRLPNGKTATVIGSAGAGKVRVRLDETNSRGQHTEATIRKSSLEIIKVPSRSTLNVTMSESVGIEPKTQSTTSAKQTEANPRTVGRRKSKEDTDAIKVLSKSGEELPNGKRYVEQSDGNIVPVISASKAKNGGFNVTTVDDKGNTYSFNTDKSGAKFVTDKDAATKGLAVESHPGYQQSLASGVNEARASREPEGFKPFEDALGRAVSRGVKTEEEVRQTVESGNFAVVSGIHGDFGKPGTDDSDSLMRALVNHGFKVNDASGMYMGQAEPSFFIKVDDEGDLNTIKRLAKEFGQTQVMFGRQGKFTAPFTNGPDVGKETFGSKLEMDFESPEAGYTIVHLDNGKDVSFSVHDLFENTRNETPLPKSVRASIPFEKMSLPKAVVQSASKFQDGSIHSEADGESVFVSPETINYIKDNVQKVLSPSLDYYGVALQSEKTSRLLAHLGNIKANLRMGKVPKNLTQSQAEALTKLHSDIRSTFEKGKPEVTNLIVVRPDRTVTDIISTRSHEATHLEQLKQGGGELRLFSKQNTAKRFLELPGVKRWAKEVKTPHYSMLDGQTMAAEIAAHYLSGEWRHLGISDDVMYDAYVDFLATMVLVEGKGDKVSELAKHALVNVEEFENVQKQNADTSSAEGRQTEPSRKAHSNLENEGPRSSEEGTQERDSGERSSGDGLGTELAQVPYKSLNPLVIYHESLTNKPRKVEEVAKELESRTRKAFGVLDSSVSEKKRINRGAAIAAAELKYQLAQERMGKDTGRNWYKDDVAKMEEGLRQIYPELADKKKMTLFKTIVAITSGGAKPRENLKLASEVWETTDGLRKPLPETKPNGTAWGLRPQVTKTATARLQKLIKDFGESGAADWLLTEHSVRELKKYNFVRGAADVQKPGMYVFGPKFGAFALNLHGISQEVTVDVWMTRSWKRWMGTVSEMTTTQGYMSEGLVERERREIKQALNRVVKDIKDETGEELTPSEAQAMLWYYEQELWRKHGAKNESQSYSLAVKKLIERKSAASQPSLFGEARAEDGEGRPDAIVGGVRQSDGEGSQAALAQGVSFDSKPLTYEGFSQALAQGRQTFTEQQQENQNLAVFDRDTWLDLVLDAAPDGVLTAKKQAEFDTLITEAQNALSTGNDKETRKKAKALLKFYGEVNPSRLPDLLNHTARAAMLLGIQVAERNAISNAIYNTTESIARYGDWGVDWALYVLGYNKQHESPNLTALAKADLYGVAKGITKGLKESGKELFKPRVSKLLSGEGIDNAVQAKFGLFSPLAKISNIGYSLTGAQDKPFREFARYRAIHDMAATVARNTSGNRAAKQAAFDAIMQSPPPEVLDKAEVAAQVAVFQQANKLNDKYQTALSKLDRTMIGRGAKAALNWVQPFVKTNLNIGNAVFDFMGIRPVFKAMVDKEAHQFYANRDAKREAGLSFEKATREAWQELKPEQRQAVQRYLSRGLVGSALMMFGIGLYLAGKLTPWDDDETQAYRNNVELSGAGPGHVKLGDYWLDIRYTGPVGAMVLSGGTFAHVMLKQGIGEKVNGALNVFQKILLESNPMAQTAQELFKDTKNGRIRAVAQPQRFIPPLSAEIARLQDRKSIFDGSGVARDTTGDDEISRTTNLIKARLPQTPLNPSFNRLALPTSADVLGREKKDPNPLLPFAPKSVVDDEVVRELGKHKTPIVRSVANKDKGETPTQLRVRQKAEGRSMEDFLRRGIGQPGYQGNEPEALKALAREGKAITTDDKLQAPEKDSNARLIVRSVEALARAKSILAEHPELSDDQKKEVLEKVQTLFTSAKASRTPNLGLPKTIPAEADITAQLYSNPDLLRTIVQQFILEVTAFKP
jgi:SLT domain-containing protein